MHLIPRAFVRQPSGQHLNLLSPDPLAWTDEDLAIGLSRTYRWGGHSVWAHPLSVAQHALTVLALRKRFANGSLTLDQQRREALHDADEALIGGFDPISPLKPFLGPEYARVVENLRAAVYLRYQLPNWEANDLRQHRRADRLAAASEAVHVAGWSRSEVHDLLNIGLAPLKKDPLVEWFDCRPWEPWPSTVAARRFLSVLADLSPHGTPSPTPLQAPQAADGNTQATQYHHERP